MSSEKLEPVRGWASKEDLAGVYNDILVELESFASEDGVPVLVIPLTPEYREAQREKVAAIIEDNRQEFIKATPVRITWRLSSDTIARNILTALRFTEEE